MNPFLLDILWRSAAWTVVAGGALLFLHALLTDAFRSRAIRRRARNAALAAGILAPDARRAANCARLRCPGGWSRILLLIPWRHGCWYDMTAATPGDDGRLLCPECGRRSTPRRLRRPRRRYALATLGLLIIGLGLAARYSRDLYRRGWSAVPDQVLVLVPFDERAWIEGTLETSDRVPAPIKGAAAELARRDGAGDLSGWTAARLGRRVRHRYALEPDHGIQPGNREAFDALSTTRFPLGAAGQPLGATVEAIGAAAGVPVHVDHSALQPEGVGAHVPVTVPPFSSMTCVQALDWACDRARARQGWGRAAWTLDHGRILLTSEADAEKRRMLLAMQIHDPRAAPSSGSIASILDRSESGPRTKVTALAADTIIWSGTQVGLLRLERLSMNLEHATGPADLPDPQAVRRLEGALRGPATPAFSAYDSLGSIATRLNERAPIPTALDTWGLDTYRTIADAIEQHRRASVDRTAPEADPFTQPAPDQYHNVEVPTAMAALNLLNAPCVHDGASLVIGLRSQTLLATTAVYRLPQAPPPHDRTAPLDGNLEYRRFLARRSELDRRLGAALTGEDGLWSRSSSFYTCPIGDRLVAVGTVDAQTLARPVIEEYLAEWAAERGAAAN